MADHPESYSSTYNLPVVSSETTRTILRELTARHHSGYFVDSLAELHLDNPSVFFAVFGFVKSQTTNESEQLLAMKAVVLAHNLLSGEAQRNIHD